MTGQGKVLNNLPKSDCATHFATRSELPRVTKSLAANADSL